MKTALKFTGCFPCSGGQLTSLDWRSLEERTAYWRHRFKLKYLEKILSLRERSHLYPDHKDIIGLLKTAPPFSNYGIEYLFLFLKGDVRQTYQQFLQLFIFEFFTSWSSKLVCITIREQVQAVTGPGLDRMELKILNALAHAYRHFINFQLSPGFTAYKERGIMCCGISDGI